MWQDVPINNIDPTLRAIAPAPLSDVVFGLRWRRAAIDNEDAARACDLDASCMLLDERNDLIEIVHPRRPRNVNGSVVHMGDCTTGGGSWDSERIHVFLRALPGDVAEVLFAVTSFNLKPFDEIGTAYCHVTNTVTDESLCGCDLTSLRSRNADFVARLLRVDDDWRLQAPHVRD